MKYGKKTLSVTTAYRHLQTGPVLLLATADKTGNPNVMALAWYTVMNARPLLVGLVVGEDHLTYQTLLTMRECTLNIPCRDLGEAVMACGKYSGRDHDKVAELGLRTSPGKSVKAPLLDDCYASFECTLFDTAFVQKYNLFVVRVVRACADASLKNPEVLYHKTGSGFHVAGPEVTLVAPVLRGYRS